MFSLAEHQIYAINMMEGNEGLAIWYEAGCGKTAIALEYILSAVKHGEIRNALIVCPAALVPNWEANIEKMAQFGHSPAEIQVLKSVTTVWSLQSVWEAYTDSKKVKGQIVQKRKYRLRKQIDHPWDCIIVDEAHCLGDSQSVQTRSMLKLAHWAKRRYVMTGTPDCGSGKTPDYQKLYGQIMFIAPDTWTSFSDFKRKYVRAVNRWGKPMEYDVQACEELKRRFGIVERLSNCFDMPEYTETLMQCPLMEKKAYQDIKKGKTLPYGFDIKMAGTQGIKLLQLCSGSLITDEGVKRMRTSKLDVLMSIIDGTEDKVVVFCTFTASIDLVAERLAKEGVTHVVYDARTKEPVWKDFQSDPGLRVFVVQYAKGYQGIDLYASSTMVFFEPTQRALYLDQGKSRIMRKGQTKHCQFIHLYTPGTVEEKTVNSVMSGVSVSKEMLDEWARESR